MSCKIILFFFSVLIAKSLELQRELPRWVEKEIYVYMYERIAQIDEIVPKLIRGGGYTNDDLKKVVQDFQNVSKNYYEFRKTLFDNISPNLRLKLSYNQINNYFEAVDYLQNVWYTPFLENLKSLETSSLPQLLTFLDQYSGTELLKVRHELLQISNLFLTRDVKFDNILEILSKDSGPLDLCVNDKSIQQLIIDLFTIAIEAYFKKTLVAYYCYTLEENLNVAKHSNDKRHVIEEFKQAVEEIYLSVITALRFASREVLRCKPKRPFKGYTYENMNEIFRIYLPNDRDMGNELPWYHDCSYLHNQKLVCRSDECKKIPMHKRCTGIIKDCDNLWNIFEICYSDRGKRRIYDWVSFQANDTFWYYGNTNLTCNRKLKLPPLFFYGPSFTKTCKCTCENEHKNLNRYFRLDDAKSDVFDNKIITGVRFVKISAVFYIQIQQATLGPYREIVDEPVWKAVEEISNDVLYSNKISTVYETGGGDRTVFHTNALVYAVSGKQNLIFLNDLQVRPNSVLTGIGLEQVGDALRLRIRDTPVDLKTGSLRRGESLWHHSEKLIESRTEVNLDEKGHPLVSEQLKTVSNNDQYVRFTTTSMKADVGQSVIPYIDLQPVMIYNPRPMTGAGLFYKGSPTSGGFLSLKLFHSNYAEWE